jgi:hypothetical protein
VSIETLTYPKIETLLKRDENFTVTDELTREEYGLIDKWLVTEKIDGCNVRLIWTRTVPVFGEAVVHHRIGGKSDDAQLHPGLLTALMFLCDSMQPEVAKVMEEFGLHSYVLFGEGYGAKIQSGGYYRADQGFILFDVLAGTAWLDEAQITDTAQRFGIERVPLLSPHRFANEGGRMTWTLDEIVYFVKFGFPSTKALIENNRHAEGIVARPPVPLYDRRGHRIMFKLKERDYRGGKR